MLGRVALIVAVVATAGAAVAAPSASARPAHEATATTAPATGHPCYGAASRDARHRCPDATLHRTVTPTPDQALLVPYGTCDTSSLATGLAPCRFGDRAAKVVNAAALVGDSHAGHWHAAVSRVLTERRWRGTSLTKSGCPFTTATLVLDVRRHGACRAWTTKVVAWLERHPTVHTVFVSDHAGARVVVAPGHSAYAAKVAGLAAAWRLLPATVVRILVIRDVPARPLATLDCVERAIAAHRPAGLRCAATRNAVLQPDPGAVAARHARDPRVRLIDLTRFFCSTRFCFPVVGGALVNKDEGHMTSAFSASLGPYLLRAVDAIAPRRRPAPGA